jgi:hypothetical protein
MPSCDFFLDGQKKGNRVKIELRDECSSSEKIFGLTYDTVINLIFTMTVGGILEIRIL